MKNSLDFLPQNIQSEITQITDKIIDEFKPEKIILFGSFARGDWVDDAYIKDGIRYTYESDYDILVITIDDLPDKKIYRKTSWVERHADKLKIKRRLSIICHDIEFVNNELKSGAYFFSDVIKEGVILFDADTTKLIAVGNVDPELARKRAKEDYAYWLENATLFERDYINNYELGKTNLRTNSHAAFYLHQITESLYVAFLLAFTNYKPKTHDLEKLGKESAKINREFLEIFPKESAEQKKCFKLLQKGYVDARYEKSYKISTEQLEYLFERISLLRSLVQELAEARFNEEG